jgi:glutamate--cysteine ligase
VSTRLKETEDRTPLEPAVLHSYFSRHAKRAQDIRIGIESECLALDPVSRRALSCSGPHGVEAVLERLSAGGGWRTIREKDRVIALHREDETVALEPGGQIEIDVPPLRRLQEVEARLARYWREMDEIASQGWAEFVSLGFQPRSQREEIEWVPKERYRWMRDRFERTGSLGHDMMKRTASTQVSLDYLDEADAMRKIRLGLLVSPLISVQTANSPFWEGRKSEWILPRLWVWENTDPARCGSPRQFLNPHASFEEYLDYALDVPMIFIVRNGEWIPVEKTFRQFLNEGESGHRATLDDFELHLSTLFPDVRLRTYIEIRLTDALPLQKTLAVAAFWKGLFYSEAALTDALRLFEKIPIPEFLDFRLEIARNGLGRTLGGKEAGEYLKALLQISREGLIQQKEDPGYLDPL